jgi:isoleucyl-tRNA synthetase
MDYSKTVNLPKTKFGMKAGLAQKEPAYIQRWDKMGLYEKQLEKRKSAPAYILHDGPPYANGEIHIGHALNKILKDIIIKYHYFKGNRTPYVPGWDCHGLPIELKVTEKLGDKAKQIPVLALRDECRKYALKFVKAQKEGFKRLGVFGEWENPYLTLSEEYEASIIEAFGELVELNYIYRGLRPILWCPSCETALAEAEIEYKDHNSPSIYVKFPVNSHKINGVKDKVYVMIWTTTPWTLPANTGLSFHPDEEYVALNVGDETAILAKKLASSVLSLKNLKPDNEITLTRDDLLSMNVRHPWIDRESKIVFGGHVTMDTGTGIVHTAPGHGMEDYFVGLENALEMLSPVDDEGRFTNDVPEWKGIKVKEANGSIIEFLDKKGLLYHHSDFSHSYPHCWRCKGPVIFRSKPQWFFRVSDKTLSEKVLSELSKIKWIPKWGEERIRNMLAGRPDWCLSRQRNWGVPIPAFYCKDCDEAVLNKGTIDNIISIVKKEGVEVWYKREAAELLPKGYKCPKCGGANFSKETDILDVWFDSGVSSLAVLDKRPNLSRPADVYLEGSDQYRGWFQASLWPSVAVRDAAPFKTIVTNGWVLDEQGKQMHKSLGNTVSPAEVFNKFGADVLRIWVVSEDYTRDLRIGEHMIQACADSYRKLRNTFRYLLGNLDGFTPENSVKYNDMLDIDKYALAKLFALSNRVEAFYDEFEFHRAFREIYNFCVIDMSNRYLDILKDRLYIYAENSKERRSAQTVLYHILKQLMIMLAPILPFTMEEIYHSYFAKSEDDSVHLEDWIFSDKEWNNGALIEEFDFLMEIRETVQKALELIRNDGIIGNSLGGKIKIKSLTGKAKTVLEKHKNDLRYIFIVSQVEICDNIDNPTFKDNSVEVSAMKADGEKCARCWNFSVETGKSDKFPELCERCAPIVENMDLSE